MHRLSLPRRPLTDAPLLRPPITAKSGSIPTPRFITALVTGGMVKPNRAATCPSRRLGRRVRGRTTERLARRKGPSDVLTENFAPDAVERLGLGYDADHASVHSRPRPTAHPAECPLIRAALPLAMKAGCPRSANVRTHSPSDAAQSHILDASAKAVGGSAADAASDVLGDPHPDAPVSACSEPQPRCRLRNRASVSARR